jgi:hypothetical protein
MAADGRTAAGDEFAVTREQASPTPVWRYPLLVWVQSEFLQTENYFRLGGRCPEFEGASWPLGTRLFSGPECRAADRLIEVNILDAEFNDRVLEAWQLPWHHSHLLIDTPPRRDSANFVIRNVGHWHKDPQRYDDIASLVSSRNPAGAQSVSTKVTYALTPFCLIAQYRLNDLARDNPGGSIAYTDLISFYTFESYVQECLASDAFRKGIDPVKIINSYDHVYCNSRPSVDALPWGVADLRLISLAGVRPGSLEFGKATQNVMSPLHAAAATDADARSIRVTLFELRLGLHLMVAIAAACCGLDVFRQNSKACPLVHIRDMPPPPDQLAGPWLGHVLGMYDHSAACQQLLATLADQHGLKLIHGPKGLEDVFLPKFEGPEPKFTNPRTAAEREIATTPLRVSRERGRQEAFDRFRWRVFEPSLDSESIERWHRWFGTRNGNTT